MVKRLTALFSFFALLFVIAACDVRTTDPDPIEDDPLEDIVDTAIAAGDFGTLVAALLEADLAEALRGEGPFTVFAPTDAAFAELLEALDITAEELLAFENLSDILLYHVLSGAFFAEDVIALVSDGPAEVETLSGEFVTLALEGSEVTVDGIPVTVTDIEASNGVIHVIDGVLLPPMEEEPELLDIVDTAIEADDFETLVAAVIEADLVEALRGEGPFTVFAPTDEAFGALLEALDLTAAELLEADFLADVLLYHVVAGEFSAEAVLDLASDGPVEVETLNGEFITISVEDGNVFINELQVIVPDVFATNGVIHVIDSVLLPPMEEEPELLDIVDTAIEADDFETLVAAVIEAELVEALRGEGPFTVFAPTDAAFGALLEALDLTAAELLEADFLADVLLYHVVAGEFSAEAVLDLASDGPVEVETLNGEFITISIEDGNVFINESQVIVPDVFATNGVIHVIDSVLLPPIEEEPELLDIVDTAIEADDFETLVAAVIEAELVEALRSEGPFTVFAPTDAAFAALLEALDLTAAELLEADFLADVLLYHVVAGEFSAEAVLDLASDGPVEVATLNGEFITISIEDGNVFINESQVIVPDVFATNGVIHVIDSVLLPPIEEEPVDTLQEQVESALDYAYDPAYEYGDVFFEDNTFFGTYTNEEIDAGQAMNDIARYLGALYRQEGSTITSIEFAGTSFTWNEAGTLLGSNWEDAEGNTLVSAIVAAFILDEDTIELTLSDGFNSLSIAFELIVALDIVDTAIAADDFNTLVAAVIEAELVEALRGEGPFTVFAPTDAAFAALLEALDATPEELLAREDLADILLYHVVAGEFSAEAVLDLTSEGPVEVETLGGATITISVEDGNVFINESQVIVPDVFATNGVIHVIDSVLLPPVEVDQE